MVHKLNNVICNIKGDSIELIKENFIESTDLIIEDLPLKPIGVVGFESGKASILFIQEQKNSDIKTLLHFCPDGYLTVLRGFVNISMGNKNNIKVLPENIGYRVLVNNSSNLNGFEIGGGPDSYGLTYLVDSDLIVFHLCLQTRDCSSTLLNKSKGKISTSFNIFRESDEGVISKVTSRIKESLAYN